MKEEDPAGGGPDRHDPVEVAKVGDDRDRTAEGRDEIAETHDKASEARDERAQTRDNRAEARELEAGTVDTGAAADRAGALRDRQGGASDRTQAADDREAASADRELSAQERVVSSIDELTGAYRRDEGMIELTREIARARRENHLFVVAFIDVVGLKARNDSRGHADGDQVLRSIVDSIRAQLRSYDLIIRFGGDEFVCALPDLTIAETAERFESVRVDLAASQQVAITVGLAELEEDDAPEDLIARADKAMYRQRAELSP